MAQPQYTNTLPLDSMLMEYHLISVLGVGGFGITYLAHDTHLDQDVAIKEYFPASDVARADGGTVTLTNTQRTDDYQTGLDRFLTEARTLAGFNHPHIIRVKRFFKAHGTGYMVMDYENGESLKVYLQKNPFPPEAALKSLLGLLLDGIVQVHKVGFLHRDIKPDNIFMRADGKPVLLDFGSARHAIGGLDRTLTTLLTPGYAPFEQYTSKSEQGPWTDIYALGGVLFYSVTGEQPPDALSRLKDDTVDEVLNQARGRYSGEFLDAIHWAIKLDEKKRPQTVTEWRRKILGDVPEEAAPDAELLARGSEATQALVAAVTVQPAIHTAPLTTARTLPMEGATLGTQDISKFLEQREQIDSALKAKFQRVLSVMFTDLKGSTALAEATGDIVVRSMLKKYHDLCIVSVKQNGGTFVKTIGDGSLSHFADAASACRAAAHIQLGMEEINLSKKYSTLLFARIGIHTGECILEKSDIFGDVVNTASRFESSANPGEILVSEDTYNAIDDKSEFYARFDREVTLKGKSMTFKAYIIFWDTKEVERDMHRVVAAPVAAKVPTPTWKIAAFIVVPLALILTAALWVKSGNQFSGTQIRSINYALPDAK